MIGLFRSNNRMVIFSEKKSSNYSKHVRDYTFITSTWKRDDLIGRVSKLVTCMQILFFFKQKIYCSFFRMARVGYRMSRITKLVISCCHHKCMIRKQFKITTNPIIRSSNFFFNIKITAGYILPAQIPNNPQGPSSTLLITNLKHLLLSVALNFLFEKNTFAY